MTSHILKDIPKAPIDPTPPVQRDRVTVLDTWIDNLSLQDTVDEIESLTASDGFSFTITTNVDHLMQLRHDPEFCQVYDAATLVVPDGVPVVWASRYLGKPLKERVNGTDLFERMCERAAQKGIPIFLLGGNEGTASTSAEVLKNRHQDLIVAGHYCPPFGFDKDQQACRTIRRQIRDSGARLLFVALGSPKQEKWILTHGQRCGVRHAIGIGASFDFVSGQIKRAPRWMQKRGLEWLWRLMQEPRRLSKRYLIRDLPFFWLVANSKMNATSS